MSIIQLKEVNCKSCYKCIRNCTLKAIAIKGGQAHIVDEDCVLCGQCINVCPQEAKYVSSDLNAVKAALKRKKTVYASVAPSYAAAFPGKRFEALSKGLKALGFTSVEETAVGAAAVSREYARLLTEGGMKNIITTCCPTINLLIEKYYPDLTASMAPVAPPATAHARMLHQLDPKALVVFIGPCVSKKHEAQSGDIFAVIMFEELVKWLKWENISLEEEDDRPQLIKSAVARMYPTPGGVIKTVAEVKSKYRFVAVDGLDRSMAMLEDLQRHPEIANCFIEMNACYNSCANGPGLKYIDNPYLLTRERLLQDAARPGQGTLSEDKKVCMDAQIQPMPFNERIPDEVTISAILASIGKTTPESMLNCGTCGYASCRDKAIAVYQGRTDLTMCLPYMREKAESLSNVIIESMPNAIILFGDEDFSILQYNRAAQSIYSIDENYGVGYPVTTYLDEDIIDAVEETGQPVKNCFRFLDATQKTVSQTLLPLPRGGYLLVAKDVSEEEAARKELEKLRRDTIAATQAVIDKQMRAAQEIASLLGETTGQSKAVLLKLKKSLTQSEENHEALL